MKRSYPNSPLELATAWIDADVSTNPADITSRFLLRSMAVATDEARHSGVTPATSSKKAFPGVYVCGPIAGMASGFSGDSCAISSAFRIARCKLASSKQ